MPDITEAFDLESAKTIIKSLQKELESTKRQLDLLRRRNSELEKLSVTDELTGLYNQRQFHVGLELEVKKSKKQNYPLCLLFFDVDGLKTYNDTYGHLGGDDVLKAVARSLSKAINAKVDTGYRYGGDEFAAILPGAYSQKAVEIARGINKILRQGDFRHVTLSFGIAELGPEMDSKALFRHADDAMYMAKRGRGIKSEDTADRIYVY